MENTKFAPFEGTKSYAQMLMFIGITLISFFILGIILVGMQMGHLVNLMTLQDAANYKDDGVVRDFRIQQLISDVFLFIVPVIVIAFLVAGRRLKYLQITLPKSFLVFLLGAVTILIATPIISYIGELNEKIQLPAIMKGWEDMGDAIEAALMAHHTVNDLVWNLVIMALAAAVSEELFFRAGMQTIMIKMFKNKHWGIWITAIIFSAIHMQFSGFFPRMFLGAFLGYLFVWSGSIWVNIFAHFMFNGIQILYSYLQDAKATTAVTDKMLSDKTDYLFAIISAVLVTLLVVVIYRLTNKKEEIMVGGDVLQ